MFQKFLQRSVSFGRCVYFLILHADDVGNNQVSGMCSALVKFTLHGCSPFYELKRPLHIDIPVHWDDFPLCKKPRYQTIHNMSVVLLLQRQNGTIRRQSAWMIRNNGYEELSERDHNRFVDAFASITVQKDMEFKDEQDFINAVVDIPVNGQIMGQ